MICFIPFQVFAFKIQLPPLHHGDVVAVAMPYVFRYLANELAGMKIKMKLTIGKGGVHG